MNAPMHDSFFARFRTSDLPERNRVTIVRDALLAKPVPFDMTPLPNDDFCLDMQVRDLPELEITVGQLVSRTTRDRSIMQDGSDDLLFAVAIEGRIETVHRGERLAIEPGMAHLGSCADPIDYYTEVRRGMCLRIPRATIAALVPDVDDRLGRQIGMAGEALRLLDTYVRALERDEFHDVPNMARLAVTHIHDLVALSIGCTGDRALGPAAGGLRTARSVAIKNDVVALLTQGDVSAEMLAARHGISPRYVRKLFELEGTTLSGFVLDEKLRRGRKMLTSPLHSHRSISSIAYDIGFNDLSYFNRTFRRKFGLTPSEARHAH
jgi:AraC-like DNA-binding protein